MKELVAYPSLNSGDYLQRGDVLSGRDYLLVIGNAFKHKRVRQTVEVLSPEFPEMEIAALGLEENTLGNVLAYKTKEVMRCS